ncbi:hypothetical protein ACFX2J_002034 [Malus domestica]
MRRISSTTHPSFNFQHFLTLPPKPVLDPPIAAFKITRLHIRKALQTLSQTTNSKAFTIDMSCDTAFDVARDLNIPTFYFYTSADNTLAVFFTETSQLIFLSPFPSPAYRNSQFRHLPTTLFYRSLKF